MTTQIFKWKIYCTTDSQYEYIWQGSAPTTCPANGGHSVDTNRVSKESEIQVVTITNTNSPYDAGQRSLLCDTTSGNITVNLPKASRSDNALILIKKTAAGNTVTISPEGSSQIDSQGSKTLTSNNETVILLSDGTDWTSQATRANVNDLDSIRHLPLTYNKGDLIVDNGLEPERVAVGTNDYLLTADSSTSSGVGWKNSLTGITINASTNTITNLTGSDVGLGNVVNLKFNLSGSTAPTANDDSGSGYSVGSRWIDVTNDEEYVCLDATSTAAVWEKTTSVDLESTDMNVAQARRTTTYTCTATYTDITFDSTDIENDTSVVEHHNTNTERLIAKDTGLYQITATCNFDALATSKPYVRFYKNGSTIVGTEYSNSMGNNNSFPFVNMSTMVSLTANDYITLQVKDSGIDKSTLRTDTVFSMIRLSGTKGDEGPPGTANWVDTLGANNIKYDAGNVAIGDPDDAPTNMLELHTVNSNDGIYIRTPDNVTSSRVFLDGVHGTGAQVMFGINPSFIGTTSNSDFSVRTFNTDRISIRNAGSIGIGGSYEIGVDIKFHGSTIKFDDFGTGFLSTNASGVLSSGALDTSDITSGTFADARIAASNVTQHEGSINHDNLSGFVANEHINHSSVSINAGTGLSGGGAITATRTIDLAINGLAADGSPDGGSDYVVTYDTSAGTHKKVLLNNLPDNGISNVVEDTTPQLGGDLDLNEKGLQYKVPNSNGEYCGEIVSATVDSNATGLGAALYMASDGNFDEADADSTSTSPCRVLAIESGTGTKKLLLKGFLHKDAWNWTPGADLYLSTTTGALTHTAPSGTGDIVQKVGYAWDADTIYFSPGDYTTVEIA